MGACRNIEDEADPKAGSISFVSPVARFLMGKTVGDIVDASGQELEIRLLCESWNERMWSDGEPIDPSPTIDQAVNGGFPWLEIRCARCKTPSDVDLAAMKNPPTTFVHDLAGRLRCRKCAKAGRRPAATLLQLAWQPRHPRTEP
jgi:hypothetical protein